MSKSVHRFLLSGGLTVLVDLFVYRLILVNGLPSEQAKMLGFLAGTAFAYWINKNWTFEAKAHSHKALPPFIALYTFSLVSNILVNEACLMLFGRAELALWAAFLVATGVSATLNFLGMQKMVFAH